MATFTDDFNRANGSVGANYDHINSGVVISTNRFNGGAIGRSYSIVKTSTASFAANQSAQITIPTVSSFDFAGVCVRFNAGTTSGYMLLTDGRSNTACRIYRVDTGTPTMIGGANVPVVNGDILKLDITGTTLTASVNGATIDTVVDATYASGQPGVMYDFQNGNNTFGDSFGATDGAGGGSAKFRDYFITG